MGSAEPGPIELPSLAELKTQLSSVVIEDDGIDGATLRESRAELDMYAREHARRLLQALRVVSRVAPAGWKTRVLELGTAPYFFSAVVSRYLGWDVVGVNVRAGVWPQTGADAERRIVTLRQNDGAGGTTTFDLPVFALNIEHDRLPFLDGSFDVVLFMETLEHLVYSPSHVLAEAGRVLKPGGALLLTTPNVLDLVKTVKLLFNRPRIGFPYSGYGPYGRHNREFTPQEVRNLVTACGLEVERLRMDNPFASWRPLTVYNVLSGLLCLLTSLPLPYLRTKRQYITLLARSTGMVTPALPEELYLFRHLYPEADQHEETLDDHE